jgi:hypothetical protein
MPHRMPDPTGSSPGRDGPGRDGPGRDGPALRRPDDSDPWLETRSTRVLRGAGALAFGRAGETDSWTRRQIQRCDLHRGRGEEDGRANQPEYAIVA